MADVRQSIAVDTTADSDSSYGGDDYASLCVDLLTSNATLRETTSLKSSLLNYEYQNGRRYQVYQKNAYWGPNDDEQADQLDIFHHLTTMMMDGKLCMAPIGDRPGRVLDVGTGTGIWAIDFADQHPDTQVIGTDLSPTQPSLVPPNLQWEIDDCTEEWTYAKDSFDFIHVRSLYGCIADWQSFYAKCLAHLKPGGYLEQVEMSVELKSDDDTVGDDHIFRKWSIVSVQCGEAFGRSLKTVDESKDGMIKAGFEDVVEHRFKIPVGDWSKDKKLKEMGMYNRLHWEQGLEGWCIFLLTNFLKWSLEEVQIYLAKMRAALRDKKIHALQEVSVVYGRKPQA